MPQPGTTMIGGKRARVTPKTYRTADFVFEGAGATLDLVADGYFEPVYVLDIEDGLGEWFGRGTQSNPIQAQGFAGVRFVNDTAAAQATGDWRLAVRSAQGRRLFNITEGDLDTYDLFDAAGNLQAREDREPYPNQVTGWETEPHELTIDLDVTANITVDDAEAQTQVRLEGYRAESMH